MTLLATGSADPNWRQRKLASAGEALSLLVSGTQQRREERRQRALDEISRFWKIGQEMPGVAAGAYGQSLVAKYGKEFPEVESLVGAFQQRDRLAQQIDRSGARYLNVLGELEQDYGQQTAAVEQMPDSFQVPMAGGLLQIPVPNVEKVFHQQRLSQVQPAALPLLAAQRLSPTERSAARLNPSVKGMMPTEFDPFSPQLSPEAHLMYAALTGQLTGDMAEYARTEGELQPSRAKLQEQGFQQGERLGRQEHEETGRVHQTSEREEGSAASLNYLRESDRLARGREAIQTSNQRGLVQMRHDLGVDSKGKPKPLWQLALDENDAYIEDWDEAWKSFEDKDEHRKQYGDRPRKMPSAHARALAGKIAARVEAGEITQDEALAETLLETERYTRLTAEGKGTPEAFQSIIQRYGPTPKTIVPPSKGIGASAKPAPRGAKETMEHLGTKLVGPRTAPAKPAPKTADPVAKAMSRVPQEQRKGVAAEVAKQRAAKKTPEQIAAWLEEAFGGE